jgi:hypothetical protein
VDLFLIAVDKNLGHPMNMSQWFAYFAFDVTEDLAFNKSSNMLANGTDSFIFAKIRADMSTLGVITKLPWVTDILKKTPVVNREFKAFWKWVDTRVEERINVGTTLPLYYILWLFLLPG